MLAATGVALLMIAPYGDVLRPLIDSLTGGQVIHDDFTVADLATLECALRMYRIHNGAYPTSEEGLQALVTRPTSPAPDIRWKRILSRLPTDSWGRPFRYELSGSGPAACPRVYSTGPDTENAGDNIEIRLNAGP